MKAPRVLAAALFTVGLAGCAVAPIDLAVLRANEAHVRDVDATTMRDQICTDSYKLAHASYVPVLDAYCEPLREAIVAHEAAWRSLMAAIVASRLGVPYFESLLADRKRRMDAAAQRLGWSLEGVH